MSTRTSMFHRVSMRQSSHKLKLLFCHFGLVKTYPEYFAWEIHHLACSLQSTNFPWFSTKNSIIDFTTTTTTTWIVCRRETRGMPVSITEEMRIRSLNSILRDLSLANECLEYCLATRVDCIQVCLRQGSATVTQVFS